VVMAEVRIGPERRRRAVLLTGGVVEDSGDRRE
jgi:hypothetical protein